MKTARGYRCLWARVRVVNERREPITSRTHLAVLLGFIAVAVWATWPLVAQIDTRLPGHTTDTFVHYWNGWWARQALTTGQSPFFTPFLFYPKGISLVYHNFAWFSIVLWLILGGGFVAFNLSVLLNLVLCGYGAFLLVHCLTGDKRAAFLAGLAYMSWPYRLAQLDHPNLISTQWIPLFMLFLVRTIRQGRWRDGALTGVFLALVGYTRWQQLIPAAIVAGVYLAFAAPEVFDKIRTSPRSMGDPALPLLLAGGIVLVALAPPALLLVDQQSTAATELLVEGEESSMQTDLLAYLTPGSSHPLMGSFTQAAYDRYYSERSGGRRFSPYIGIVTLALALLGAWKSRRLSLPWAAAALALFLLALGPVLRINGQLFPDLPMPYGLAAQSFVIRLLRFPDRFNMFLALPVVVLAGYGIAYAIDVTQRRGRRAAQLVPYLLGCAILFEYLGFPASLQHPQVSPVFAEMAAEADDFAVLNLPINPQKAKWYMFAQVYHQRPILQGKTARVPPGTYAYLTSNPWLRFLQQHNEMSPELSNVSRQLASLAEDNIRYIILHRTHVEADRLARWQRYLLIDPRFEDAQVTVYPTNPLAGRDFTLANELAPGVGPIRVITSTNCVNPGHVLGIDVGWGTTETLAQDYDVQLTLVAKDGAIRHKEVFPLSPAGPTGGWPANTVAWGYYTLAAPPSLSAGVYSATLVLVDSSTAAVHGQSMVLGQVTVSETPCAFAAPQGAVSTNALFGDELRLLGYQLDRDGDRLSVTLFWRSEHRMDVDYKIFVHVFDAATGAVATQDDSMPQRWGFPTTFWGPGETVTDSIPLSLEQVPQGAYGAAVGVYDPTTLDRLPVLDGHGQLQPDGRLVLPGETIQVDPNR